MPLRLFFGADTDVLNGNTQPSTGYHRVSIDTALQGGLVTELRFDGVGNIKPSLYEAAADAPTNLLWSDNVGQYIGPGWSSISITPTSVTGGNQYGIGGIQETIGGLLSISGQSSNIAYKAAAYAGFVAPDPATGYTLLAWNYRYAYAAYGWIAPTIDGINTTRLYRGQSGAILSGVDFMDSAATLWICPTDNATDPDRVEASISAQSDTELTFGVPDGLEDGTYYLFVTTVLGLRNETPIQVTVKPGGVMSRNGRLNVPWNGRIGNGRL